MFKRRRGKDYQFQICNWELRKKSKIEERIIIEKEYHLWSDTSYNTNGNSKIRKFYWKDLNKNRESTKIDGGTTINS